jgi:hypothetical protein
VSLPLDRVSDSRQASNNRSVDIRKTCIPILTIFKAKLLAVSYVVLYGLNNTIDRLVVRYGPPVSRGLQFEEH